MLEASLSALGGEFPEADEVLDAEVRHQQIIRLIALTPVLAALGHRQRVDGEVAAGGVLGPVVGEHDVGPAAMGLDVEAKRGDLEMLGPHHRRDGTVLDPRGERLDARRRQQLDDPLRRFMGGDIDIAHRKAEDRIAHAATDEARRAAAGGERLHHRPGRGGGHPGFRRHAADRGHGPSSHSARSGRIEPFDRTMR